MDIPDILIFLAIGALVGWFAGKIVKGRGFGLLGNIVVGIVGSVFGGYVFGLLGVTARGQFGPFIMALIGAVILLVIISIVKRI
jgi:uncharacterized membrane protein YeaQ/YmgE (transglycosylase-associated protein family)